MYSVRGTLVPPVVMVKVAGLAVAYCVEVLVDGPVGAVVFLPLVDDVRTFPLAAVRRVVEGHGDVVDALVQVGHRALVVLEGGRDDEVRDAGVGLALVP
jgi:hypothetical protein